MNVAKSEKCVRISENLSVSHLESSLLQNYPRTVKSGLHPINEITNMKTENIYLIWAHPRADSLTARVVEEMQEQAARDGNSTTTLDLYRRGFDPVLGTEDEPAWDDSTKR